MDHTITVKKRKPYAAPIRLMVFLSIFVTVTTVSTIISVSVLQARYNMRRTEVNYFLLALWPVLIWVETFFYRLTRKKIKKSSAVWAHVICNLVCFCVIPILFVIIPVVIAVTDVHAPYLKSMLFTSRIRFFVFWLLFITGHAFFITTIADIFGKKETDGNEPTPGILDGILDEY